MIQRINLILLVVLALLGCESKQIDKENPFNSTNFEFNNTSNTVDTVSVSIEIRRLQTSIQIYIERFYGSSFKPFQKVELDEQNNIIKLQLEPQANIGLYRATLADNNATPNYFIINGLEQKIKINSNHLDFFNGKAEVLPSTELDCHEKIKEVYEWNEAELETIAKKLNNIDIIDPRYYSKKQYLREQLEEQNRQFYRSLSSLDVCQNTLSGSIYINLLRNPSRLNDTILKAQFETESALLHKTYFDNFDKNDERNLGFPIFYQGVDEYLRKYDGRSFDDNIKSVDIVMNGVENRAIKTFLVESMLKFYLSKEAFEVVNYITTNHFSGCDTEVLDSITQDPWYYPGPEVGDLAPPIVLPDSRGSVVNIIEEAKSSTLTVVYFWLSSCDHCQAEHPKMKQLSSRYSGNGIKLYGVSIDIEEEQFLKTIQDFSLDFPNLCNFQGEKSEHLGDRFKWEGSC